MDTSFPSTSLTPGDRLPEEDTISHYCQRGQYDRNSDQPKLTAFQKRPKERDPDGYSVNHLQYYKGLSERVATDRIRAEFVNDGYGVDKKGRFIVFSVGKAICTAARDARIHLSVIYDPLCAYPSHALIPEMPEPETEDALNVATALKRMFMQDKKVYPGLP